MSHMFRESARLAIAGVAAAAALGATASSASAATLTLDYQCKYPLVGVQPLKIKIDAAIPSAWKVDKLTNAFTIDVDATAGGSTAKALQLIGAQTLEGVAQADATLNTPDGFAQELSVPISITNWTSPGAVVSPPLELEATGSTPPVIFDTKGTANVTVDKIALNLTARNATGQAIPLQPVTKDLDGNPLTPSDSDPGTFDVPCKLAPASQSTRLAEITVNDTGQTSSDTQAPGTPGTVNVATTATSATLNWSAATDNTGVVAYDVLQNGSPVASAPGTKISLPNLAPGTTTNYTLVARDAAGNVGQPRAFSVSTPANVVATGAIAKYTADLNGTASMRTLVSGNLPLKGGIVADMTVIDGKYTADLTLNPTTGRLNAIGILPVTARVGFVSAARTTGDLTDGVLTAVAKLRIKLLDVKLFGAIPLAGGNNCQTKSISTITLRSGANFDPVVGGAISGSFALSELNNCGILTGIVSPITAGGGNRINATLVPKL